MQRIVQEFEMFPGSMRRVGVIMEPDASDPREVGGVLNPAVVRGADGQVYMLPRVVAAGNYSRIGLTRVLFNPRGMPKGVERMGMALEPRESYEINAKTGGGVEDPRIVYLAARHCYVMLYIAYGPRGPRIAGALSRDLVHWHRIGLVRFAPYNGVDLSEHDNKDALLFPEPVPAPDGRPALALIHRPTFRVAPRKTAQSALPPSVGPSRPSMWISYAPIADIIARRHVVFTQHHVLAAPQAPWERLRIGGGAPPIRLDSGWLVFYHGVSGKLVEGVDQQQLLRYSAGLMLLDPRDPRQVLYRSARSVLGPSVAAERRGVVPNVVFPTGIDRSDRNTLHIYYGMADKRIGAALYHLDGVRVGGRVRAA